MLFAIPVLGKMDGIFVFVTRLEMRGDYSVQSLGPIDLLVNGDRVSKNL